MAATANVTLDTPITIKISVGDDAKKLKLPLRDLTAEALPTKLKSLLCLPGDKKVVFERFSDSAGGYVTLEADNPGVYKTLVRAAKAKLKLRLRAVVEETEQERDAASAAQPAPLPKIKPAPVRSLFDAPHGPHLPVVIQTQAAKEAILQAALANNSTSGRSNLGAGIFEFKQGHIPTHSASARPPITAPAIFRSYSAEAPLPRAFNVPTPALDAADAKSRNILNTSAPPPAGLALRAKQEVLPPPPPCWTPHSGTWSVYCNNCDAIMHNEHFHCSICDGGDYDLCTKCAQDGFLCPGHGHWMVKRFINEGQVVTSITERLYPSQHQHQHQHQHQKVKPESTPASKVPVALRAPPVPVPTAAIKDAIRNALSSAPFHDFKPACSLAVAASVPPSAPGPVPRSAPAPVPRSAPAPVPYSAPPGAFPEEFRNYYDEPYPMRTCNSCVIELPDGDFVTCKNCDDFDLCKVCHLGNRHGHHPGHVFEPTLQGQRMTTTQKKLLPAGRNARHWAICDGCDKHIVGVRHKCLDCPDFDYCNDCSVRSILTHSGHRFVPIYAPIKASKQSAVRHLGIYCDGEACTSKPHQSYIHGVRYKCVICDDTDFCASCESHPGNKHNKTHPLLKFTTPVRGVVVKSINETGPNLFVTGLGDQERKSASPEPVRASPACSANAASSVKTVADIAPSAVAASVETIFIEDIHKQSEIAAKAEEVKSEEVKVDEVKATEAKAEETKVEEAKPSEEQPELAANFVCDIIPDGIHVREDSRFTQVWTMHNPGPLSWPAGCSVHFIGGDNMLNLSRDSAFSAAALAAATESNVTAREVAPGESVAFKVVLKAPMRAGKAISYWRLKTPDGMPFGHRLWCDIHVNMVPYADDGPAKRGNECVKSASCQKAKDSASVSDESTLTGSRMVYPTLDKESPDASSANIKAPAATCEDEATGEVSAAIAAPAIEAEVEEDQEEVFEDVTSEMETLSACSEFSEDDGFLTDEEYDILDASDQETVASD